MTRDQCKWYWKGFDDAKAKLEQRSANEYGEPVATFDEVWDSIEWDKWRMEPIRELCRMIISKTTLPPVSEPHKLKPLTDEQMLQALNHFSENPSEYRYSDPLICFARAIEAAHNIHPTGFKE